MKPFLKLSFVAVSFFALTSCQNEPFSHMDQEQPIANQELMAQHEPVDAKAENSSDGRIELKASEKVIKQGQLSLEVEDYAKSFKRMKGMVRKYNGYIADQLQNNSTHQTSNSLTIRVPNGKYEGLFEDLAEEAKRIESKKTTTTDVGLTFVDLEARLKAKRAVEARYLDLLNRAQNIKEILKVEGQVRVIQEEIEAAQSRLLHLQDQVQYSTIRLTLYQLHPVELVAETAPTFWDQFSGGLGNGWKGILVLFIGLANVWPILLIGALVFFLIRRSLRKRKTAATPPQFQA